MSPLCGVAKLTGPFGRLAKQGFYIDDAVFFLLTMPLRGLAQIARLIDWLVVENLVVGIPSKYPGWIAKVASPLRQPSPGLSLLSTCVGLGVMLLIVVIQLLIQSNVGKVFAVASVCVSFRIKS